MILSIEQLAYAGSYEQLKQAVAILAGCFSDLPPDGPVGHADKLEAALSTVNAAAAQFQQCHDNLESAVLPDNKQRFMETARKFTTEATDES